MTISRWLDCQNCPPERPPLALMSARTRDLHNAIDDRIKATGIPSLHPTQDTILEDLFGSPQMIAWQENKGLMLFTGEDCWSDLPPIYARYGSHPTRRLLAALRKLESARCAVVADSGMSAIGLTIDGVLEPGSHAILLGQVYNKSRRYLEWAVERLGGRLTIVSGDQPEALAAAICPETRLIFAETFTNPLLRACDLTHLSATALEARRTNTPMLRVVLDTTIATPWGFKSGVLDLPGIDVVVASGTKALGGQDTDLWGYLATNDIPLANQIMDLQAMRGGVLDSRRAAVIESGLDDAGIRHARRCATAIKVAEFLQGHPRVSQVFHPGLDSHQDARVIAEHHDRTASLLSFRVVDADESQTRHFADVLATCVIVRYALSFDGLVTKVNHHTTVSEYYTPAPILKNSDVDRLIRLGVGTEGVDDLIACLNWSLWHGASLSPESLAAWRLERTRNLGLGQA